VAAWLLRARPEVMPTDADPERLSAIRARTELIDHLVLQVVEEGVRGGRSASIYTLGAGFDARWARLAGPLASQVDRWVEVEEPRVSAWKRAALAESPFADLWGRVDGVAVVPQGWAVEPTRDERSVVVMEGLLHRLPAQGLRILLGRIRDRAPDARVLLDLTGAHGIARVAWSGRRLREAGWRVHDDLELGYRDMVLDVQGREVAAGMVPVRILHLSPADGP
jgi:O-methyltransferase involved in polyketide biosynthesis